MQFHINFLLLTVFLAIIYQACGRVLEANEEAEIQRSKRDHHQGITGPVHTFVKTDKHANFKWGVRHHVGHHYSG